MLENGKEKFNLKTEKLEIILGLSEGVNRCVRSLSSISPSKSNSLLVKHLTLKDKSQKELLEERNRKLEKIRIHLREKWVKK